MLARTASGAGAGTERVALAALLAAAGGDLASGRTVLTNGACTTGAVGPGPAGATLLLAENPPPAATEGTAAGTAREAALTEENIPEGRVVPDVNESRSPDGARAAPAGDGVGRAPTVEVALA